MDAKYFSYIHAIDPVIKLMAARGRGVIVNIIGNGGKVASQVHIAGGAANAALMLATAGLGHAYAARGVRVVGLNPGLTETGRVTEGFTSIARLEQISLEEARAQGHQPHPDGPHGLARGSGQRHLVPGLGKSRLHHRSHGVSMDGAESPVVL